ncbi:MAG: methyltransferase domain-containing protein [Candidatus Dadabacteria bacterium]|nr:methyltransferase domain-containing protein [Candidatus Dadabacteria bacterium]MYA47826.1 methyltransferase domain-containing protein [Candidatus Dadabacteria bacterium]MYG82561.1 methyltransferase domain-containing protein [Candidatus Dadabacteria bacterium]MYK49884.1 methyltransferase domain-containing protein [Candidatus Dadabacteria bacterium]
MDKTFQTTIINLICVLSEAPLKLGIYGYIKQFLRDPKSTGSITPSNEELSELVTETARLGEMGTVVELGPGTGVFTEKILEKKKPDALFFAIEINPEFYEATKSRCPSATVYKDSAENMKKYLEQHGKDSCDCIISSLPWAVFDHGTQDRLLDVIWDVLRPGGKMITFSYSISMMVPNARRFRSILRSKFSNVAKSKTVWSNFPPAFVYSAKK